VADASLTHGVWLDRAPDLVAQCVEEWGLQLGDSYVGGAAGHVHRVELPDGTPGVLKVWFPHRESEHEPDALALWNGEGAVRLLAHDSLRSALLIERCEPGTTLTRPVPRGHST
jgi:streptomycin 6-kinase